MTKRSRDNRIENRRLSHITCDESILNEMLGPVDKVSFVGKDDNGFSEELEDVTFYEYGSEEHIQAERKIRYEHN